MPRIPAALRDKEIATRIGDPRRTATDEMGYEDILDEIREYGHPVDTRTARKSSTPLPTAIALAALTGVVGYIAYKRVTSRRTSGPSGPQPPRYQGT